MYQHTPGEGRQPKSILNDKFCEELSFPHLFPTGKYGYQVQREKTLSAVKYFNQRLLNYTQKFASDRDYIFFARNVLQNKNMLEQLGLPNIFLTLSSADLRWNELVNIIQKLNKADCNISNLSYHDRFSILNSNPAIVARHFQ